MLPAGCCCCCFPRGVCAATMDVCWSQDGEHFALLSTKTAKIMKTVGTNGSVDVKVPEGASSPVSCMLERI